MMTRIKFNILFIVLSVMSVICLGLFTMPKMEVYAGSSDTVDSYYMYNKSDNIVSPFKSTIVAGTTSGYDHYRINQRAVLTSTANDGFEFKGWFVKYLDTTNAEKTMFIEGQIGDVSAEISQYNVSLATHGSDTNGDNRIDSATITIDPVFASLEIEPVFDYIYYNVLINDLASMMRFDSFKTITLDEDSIVYYVENVQGKVSGVLVSNKFTHSILKDGDNYYYIGDMYEKEGEYFTKHTKYASSISDEYIALARGAFRLGADVNIGTFRIDCANDDETVDFENDKFVKITGFGIESNGLVANLGENDRVINNHTDLHFTTAFSLAFKIRFDSRQTNKVLPISEELYRLTIEMNMVDRYINAENTTTDTQYATVYGIGQDKFIVNNKNKETVEIDSYASMIARDEISSEVLNWLLSTVKIDFAFAQYSANQYLVLPSQAINVKCTGYDHTINNVSYDYYDYICSDKYSLTSTAKSVSLSEDTVIDLYYAPSIYEINYEFRLYDEDKDGNPILSSQTGDFNINQTGYYKRGTNVTFAEAPENIGYIFKGYYNYNSADTKYENKSEITINASTPDDIKIYMAYDYIMYTLYLKDHSYDKVLEYDGKSIRALNNVEITINGDQTIRVSEGFDSEIELGNINIGDLFNLRAVVNNGFNFVKFTLDNGSQNVVLSGDTEFTEELIDLYATGTVADQKIVIYTYEEYKTSYNLTYEIAPYYDTENEVYVAMAHLSADLTSGTSAVMTKYDINGNVVISDTDEFGNPIIVQKIVFSNLRLYETVYLRSKALQLPDGQQYLFNYYTANSTSALASSFVKEGDGSNLYTREEIISPDRERIYVVYSLPSAMINLFTQLKDDNGNNLDSADSMIDVSRVSIFRNDILMLPDETGRTYKIEFDDDISINTADMKVVLDLSNTDFGYYYFGHDFVVEDMIVSSSEDIDQNIVTIEFVCTSNVIYNLNFNFKLIKYLFNLTVDGNVGEPIQDTLTVRDMTLDFDKTEGKYVDSFLYNGVSIDNNTFGMNESNESNMSLDNKAYNYTFEDTDLLADFVGRYAVVEDTTSLITNLVIVYRDYTYSVDLAFSITNAKGIPQEDLMNYPAITFIATRGGVEVGGIVIENNRKNISYQNIPYGADISINVDMSTMEGFQYRNWINLNANGNASIITGNEIGKYTANSMEISSVVKNYNLGYSFGYIAYTISPQYSKLEGAPRVIVNGKDANKITRFDSLQISPNPSTASGFKFNSIYVDYKYNEATFTEDFEKLYTVVDVANGVFTKNTEEYDSNKSYYIRLDVDGGNYNEASFDVSNYLIKDADKIYIYFHYDMKLVTIQNDYAYSGSRKLSGKGNDKAKIDISIDDIANYKVFATSKMRPDEVEREIGENGTVNYYDLVRIAIQINDSALERISGLHYDLRNNVTVTSASILSKNKTLTEGENGYYELVFSMSDIIGSMASTSDILTVSYKYQVENYTVELTTNITNEDFYKKDGVKLVIYASTFGFSKNNYNNTSKPTASTKMQYLASSGFGYTLDVVSGVDYNELFKISGVKVYVNGELLPLDKYENLVEIQYLDEEKSIIEQVNLIRIIGNMKVEFIMQPTISIRNEDGKYVELTSGTYNITKMYSCDSNGVGKEQTLTIGQMESTSVDIQVADIVLDAMQLTYRDKLGFVTTPTTVGTYTVEISFNSSSEEFKWLQEFTGGLLSTVNLVITPRPLEITCNSTIVEKVEKEYDSSYHYDIEQVLKYLQFEFVNSSGAKIEIPYFEAISGQYAKFNIKTDNFDKMARITHSTDAGQIEIAMADESTHYNVYITGIELDPSNAMNQNFVLSNNSVIIEDYIRINRRILSVEGLKVNDKVNDTTTKASVDISNARLVNVVSGDDISLVADKIVVEFTDSSEGYNKDVTVNLSGALYGLPDQVDNYKIGTITTTATIYPYSRSCDIEGFGTLVIKNDRGLTDPQYASLIPVNADFKVELVNTGHEDYNTLRKGVANHLSRMKVFGYGYKLYFTVNGQRVDVDKHLYLVAPETNRIAGVLYYDEEAGSVNYQKGELNKTILIDLSQVKGDVNYLVITEQRDLLELWQIILIVSIVVLILIAIITVLLILRRRKKIKYGEHEKI